MYEPWIVKKIQWGVFMENKKKILIADDDRDFVAVLQTRLEHEGYDVFYAYEGFRVIEIAHKERPDLIVLDWKMPAGKGDSVMESLAKREDTNKIPVIIITGVGDQAVEEKVMHLGAKYFVRKPLDAKDFLEKIKNAIL